MGATSRVGECVGSDLSAGEKNVFTAVGGCVCVGLLCTPCPHPQDTALAMTSPEMSPAWGVSSSPPAPEHVGAHRGDGAHLPPLGDQLPLPKPPPYFQRTLQSGAEPRRR